MDHLESLKRNIKYQMLNLMNPNEALKLYSRSSVGFTRKYPITNAEELILNNCKSLLDVRFLIVALKVLSKYADNLLLPVQMRPNGWKNISYFNKVYNEKVHPVKGSDEILQKLNYKKLPNRDFIYNNKSSADKDNIAQILLELKSLKLELISWLEGKHDNKSYLDGLLVVANQRFQDEENKIINNETESYPNSSVTPTSSTTMPSKSQEEFVNQKKFEKLKPLTLFPQKQRQRPDLTSNRYETDSDEYIPPEDPPNNETMIKYPTTIMLNNNNNNNIPLHFHNKLTEPPLPPQTRPYINFHVKPVVLSTTSTAESESEDVSAVVEEMSVDDQWECTTCTMLNPHTTKLCRLDKRSSLSSSSLMSLTSPLPLSSSSSSSSLLSSPSFIRGHTCEMCSKTTEVSCPLFQRMVSKMHSSATSAMPLMEKTPTPIKVKMGHPLRSERLENNTGLGIRDVPGIESTLNNIGGDQPKNEGIRCKDEGVRNPWCLDNLKMVDFIEMLESELGSSSDDEIKYLTYKIFPWKHSSSSSSSSTTTSTTSTTTSSSSPSITTTSSSLTTSATTTTTTTTTPSELLITQPSTTTPPSSSSPSSSLSSSSLLPLEPTPLLSPSPVPYASLTPSLTCNNTQQQHQQQQQQQQHLHHWRFVIENWKKAIDSTKSILQRNKVLTERDISKPLLKMVKKSLISSDGDVKKAVECFSSKWDELLNELDTLCMTPHMSREDRKEALSECDGDLNATVTYLLKTSFFNNAWGIKRAEGVTSSRDVLSVTDDMSLDEVYSNSKILDKEIHDKINDRELSLERRIRMLIAESDLTTWTQAQIVIRLLDEETVSNNHQQQQQQHQLLGTQQLSPQLQLSNQQLLNINDYIEAAKEFVRYEDVKVNLTKECLICCYDYPKRYFINFFNCQCRFCRSCCVNHFKNTIMTKSVVEMKCPICCKPDIKEMSTDTTDYFTKLFYMLKPFFDENTFMIFDNKLVEWSLKNEQLFRCPWDCTGLFTYDLVEIIKPILCPGCKHYFCAKCKSKWVNAKHVCELHSEKLMDIMNVLECPECREVMELVAGGCLHFKCPCCSHQFCGGCRKTFSMTKKKGLDCNHPRNCLAFLRDFDISSLQRLLEMNNVRYKTSPSTPSSLSLPSSSSLSSSSPSSSSSSTSGCFIKVMNDDKVEGPCGDEVPDGCAGMCCKHYKEYLADEINKYRLDPLYIMPVTKLRNYFRTSFEDNKDAMDAEASLMLRCVERYDEKQLIQKLIKHFPLAILTKSPITFESAMTSKYLDGYYNTIPQQHQPSNQPDERYITHMPYRPNPRGGRYEIDEDDDDGTKLVGRNGTVDYSVGGNRQYVANNGIDNVFGCFGLSANTIEQMRGGGEFGVDGGGGGGGGGDDEDEEEVDRVKMISEGEMKRLMSLKMAESVSE